MTKKPRYILHCPVSNEELLDEFVERCIAEKVCILAVVGPDCERIEEIVDELVVGDGCNADRYLTTSSHPGETLREVLLFLESWFEDDLGPVLQFRL